MAKEKKEDFGSGFLYVENLLHDRQYRTVSVTIEEVIPKNTITSANKKLIDQPILKFVGKERMLVLNKTNQSILRVSIGDDDLSKAVGVSITLQPRIVEGWGDLMPAIRVMPPEGVKIRKNLLKRLGEKAVWTGPPVTTTEKPKKADEPERSTFDVMLDKINGKSPAQAIKQQQIIRTSMDEMSEAGKITDDQYNQLGVALNSKLAESQDTPEEPTEAEATE